MSGLECFRPVKMEVEAGIRKYTYLWNRIPPSRITWAFGFLSMSLCDYPHAKGLQILN